MKNVTELEMNILKQFARKHFGGEFLTEYEGDENPSAHPDTWLNFRDLDGDPRQTRGALSSLMQKGLVQSEEIYGHADVYYIRLEAYNLVKEAA